MIVSQQNIHVIGAGAGIGRWLVEHCFQQAYCYDLSTKALRTLPTAAKACPVEESGDYGPYRDNFQPNDWILFAVPMTGFHTTVESLVPFLKAGSLLVTLSSVQEDPIKILKTLNPPGCSVLGCHPLFGATLHSGVGQITALTEYNEKDSQHRHFRNALMERGLITTILVPDEHDRYMAYVQALTHFCLLGFAATLGNTGVHPRDLLKLKTPNFQFLYAFASRIIKLSPTTTGAIQSTTDAVKIREKLLETLSRLHLDFVTAPDIAARAKIIDNMRSPLTGSEVDEGAEIAAVAVDSIQRFEELLHRYRASKSLFVFRHRTSGIIKIARILEIRHDEIEYEESTRSIVREGNTYLAVGLGSQAAENYRKIGITCPKPTSQLIKKRNIKLLTAKEVRAVLRDAVLPITTEHNFNNPHGLDEVYFEALLSKTGANLAAHAVNEDFACPKMEF
jgi:prephenate dehydrogenase